MCMYNNSYKNHKNLYMYRKRIEKNDAIGTLLIPLPKIKLKKKLFW